MNPKMKTILIAGLALGLSTSVAMAEGLPTMPEITFPEVEVSVGAERALEAERQAKEAMKNSDNEIDTSKAQTELMQAAAQLRLIKKLRSNTKK